MRRVVVRIDELVLRGFPPATRHAIARGLQQQLTELLSAPGAAERLAQIGALPELRTKLQGQRVDTKAERIGAAAATGVGKGLGL